MYTMRDKFAAAGRELLLRKRVYPRLVEEGRMTDGFAATQIAIFAEIVEDYRNLMKDEELPLVMPGEVKS
jgi:hypothetical protein